MTPLKGLEFASLIPVGTDFTTTFAPWDSGRAGFTMPAEL